MRFSTKAEYGLKAMVNLAVCFPQQKAISELALEESISHKYLERLMNMLRKEKLVHSTKGVGGGYFLARRPHDIAVGEIVEALEGPIAPMACNGCTSQEQCPSSLVWSTLGTQIKKTLDNIKLNDLTK